MTTIQFHNSLTGLEKKMYYFALSLTSNSENARDLVQETFLRALTYQTRFMADTNLIAWVYTIMKNTFINQYRRNLKTKSTFEIHSDIYQISYSTDQYCSSVDSIHSANEINKKINRLHDEFREPFQLFLNGFKYREISEKLDLPLGTVKSRIFFTRKKLFVSLSDYIN